MRQPIRSKIPKAAMSAWVLAGSIPVTVTEAPVTAAAAHGYTAAEASASTMNEAGRYPPGATVRERLSSHRASAPNAAMTSRVVSR